MIIYLTLNTVLLIKRNVHRKNRAVVEFRIPIAKFSLGRIIETLIFRAGASRT